MRKRTGRKLLVATLGVAAVSYVAYAGSCVANLMAPPHDDGGAEDSAAADTRADTSPTDTFSPLDLVANIVAPQ